MKNKTILIAAIVAINFLASCAGSSDKPPETATNRHDEVKSVDTTKTTTTTGSATMVDNSGSGGTNIDTPKKSTPAP